VGQRAARRALPLANRERKFATRSLGGGALLLFAALAGCCGRRVDLPPIADVSGTVTLDGAPVPNASVRFIPDAIDLTIWKTADE
jgi:hypothetical protein